MLFAFVIKKYYICIMKQMFNIGDGVEIKRDGFSFSCNISSMKGHDKEYVRRYKPINAYFLSDGRLIIKSYYGTQKSLGVRKDLTWKVRFVMPREEIKRIFYIISSNKNHVLVVCEEAFTE